jgi:hypothetical protein
MVRQAGTPNDDNESTFGGYPRDGDARGNEQDVAVAHTAPAAYELHDLASLSPGATRRS